VNGIMTTKVLLKFLLRKVFNMIGYDIHISKKVERQDVVIVDKNMWLPYLINDESMRLYYKGLNHSGNKSSDNFYKQLRFYSLQNLVRYVLEKNIEGDFVECGVWKGHSAYIVSSMLLDVGFNGEFHIFDSFEGGLSDKVGFDNNLKINLSKEQITKEKDLFSSTEEQVRLCLSGFDFVRLYKGWIPERFNEVNNLDFSFVHLDVDLYEPTLDSLNYFYPRLVDGGIVVCDDYGSSIFPGATKAIDEFVECNIYKMFYRVPMGGCFIVK